MRHNPSLPQEQVYEQASWVTEKKGAATRRALDGVGPAVEASGDKALEEVHRLLEEAPAEACTLVAEVAQRCPEGAQELMRALIREVRDVFVLRRLCQMEPRDQGNRDPIPQGCGEGIRPNLENLPYM